MRMLVLLTACCALAACGDDTPRTHENSVDTSIAVAKPARAPEVVVPVGQRRTILLEHGGSIEIVVEGDGPTVARGDEVWLDYTISYVPKAEAAKSADTVKDDTQADDAKPAKTNAGKDGDAPSDTAKAAEPKADVTTAQAAGADTAKNDVAQVDAAATTTAPTDATQTDAQKSDASNEALPNKTIEAAATTADAKSDATEAAPVTTTAPAGETVVTSKSPASDVASSRDDTALDTPVAALPIASLEPIIVASTRPFAAPDRVVLGEKGPLLPALSEALCGLKVGTRAVIVLPPALGYAADAARAAGLPPDATLTCEVTLRGLR